MTDNVIVVAHGYKPDAQEMKDRIEAELGREATMRELAIITTYLREADATDDMQRKEELAQACALALEQDKVGR